MTYTTQEVLALLGIHSRWWLNKLAARNPSAFVIVSQGGGYGRQKMYAKEPLDAYIKALNEVKKFEVELQQGVRMPIEIKRSGTKETVKITSPITNLLNSIRSQHISPQKGTKNPPHLHVKIKNQK